MGFFSNFYKFDFSIIKQLIFQFLPYVKYEHLVVDILTTPVFDNPLLSPDVIILVENLDTAGKSFQPRKIFLKLFSCFWLWGKYNMIYRCT